MSAAHRVAASLTAIVVLQTWQRNKLIAKAVKERKVLQKGMRAHIARQATLTFDEYV